MSARALRSLAGMTAALLLFVCGCTASTPVSAEATPPPALTPDPSPTPLHNPVAAIYHDFQEATGDRLSALYAALDANGGVEAIELELLLAALEEKWRSGSVTFGLLYSSDGLSFASEGVGGIPGSGKVSVQQEGCGLAYDATDGCSYFGVLREGALRFRCSGGQSEPYRATLFLGDTPACVVETDAARYVLLFEAQAVSLRHSALLRALPTPAPTAAPAPTPTAADEEESAADSEPLATPSPVWEDFDTLAQMLENTAPLCEYRDGALTLVEQAPEEQLPGGTPQVEN